MVQSKLDSIYKKRKNMESDQVATLTKFQNLRQYFADLRVRDKRAIFLLMRTASDTLNTDTFFPVYGFTAGEFAVGQVLAENNRKSIVRGGTGASASKKPAAR